jgi:hypothetical protein
MLAAESEWLSPFLLFCAPRFGTTLGIQKKKILSRVVSWPEVFILSLSLSTDNLVIDFSLDCSISTLCWWQGFLRRFQSLSPGSACGRGRGIVRGLLLILLGIDNFCKP